MCVTSKCSGKSHLRFPLGNSERTMLALKEKQLNSLTRNEIVQGISAKIFNRCKYPISSQVTRVPICH